jgi:hypothetical protein
VSAAATAALDGAAAKPPRSLRSAEQRAEWGSRLAELRGAAPTGRAFREAASRSLAWVEALLGAKRVIIDANLPPLTEHLRTIQLDGCAAAVRAMQSQADGPGGAPPTEAMAAAKAADLVASLQAAVRNGIEQFTRGLRSALPPPLVAQMGSGLADSMCQEAADTSCKALFEMARVDELTARIWEEVSLMSGFLGAVSKLGTQRWLHAMLSSHNIQPGETAEEAARAAGVPSLELPAGVVDFISNHISRHLDPYIDGEILTKEDERGTVPMLPQLQEVYRKEHDRPLPAPPELVLALYVIHAVAKSDATQCFTELVMGQGRLPITGQPQTAHCKALGKAVEQAVVRDFGPSLRSIQGVQVTAALVESLAKEHTSSLFGEHYRAAERLAEANKQGEIGRKDEMKRIFGLEI